jgi:hypothetical protein
MSKLYISEYLDSAQTEPAIAEQTLEIGVVSAQSEPFDSRTKSIRLHVEASCSIAFGAEPVATAENGRLAADTSETRNVSPGGRLRLAVIENVTKDDGYSFVRLNQLLTERGIQ